MNKRTELDLARWVVRVSDATGRSWLAYGGLAFNRAAAERHAASIEAIHHGLRAEVEERPTLAKIQHPAQHEEAPQ